MAPSQCGIHFIPSLLMTTDEKEDTLDTLRLPSRINSTLPTPLSFTPNIPEVGYRPVPTKDDTLLPFLPQLHPLPVVSTTRPQSISWLHHQFRICLYHRRFCRSQSLKLVGNHTYCLHRKAVGVCSPLLKTICSPRQCSARRVNRRAASISIIELTPLPNVVVPAPGNGITSLPPVPEARRSLHMQGMKYRDRANKRHDWCIWRALFER